MAPGYQLHVHVGCGGGEVHLPCHVQAAEVVGHQGGRLHPLQGVGALVLAAGGGSGGCGHLHGHLVGQAAGGGWHLWVQQVGGGLGHAAGGQCWLLLLLVLLVLVVLYKSEVYSCLPASFPLSS